MNESDLRKVAEKLPLSASVIARNRVEQCDSVPGNTVEIKMVKSKRIRQDTKPLLNKLESEWLERLMIEYPFAEIWKQALRWRLGNGIWYKPDFAAFAGWTQKPSKLTCWEVKGPHSFRGGFENLKVAASLYQEVRWVLVWKEKGEWNQQDVLP